MDKKQEVSNDTLRVYAKYGANHLIEKVMGTEVNLRDLKDNESVVMGDGKTYHWKLTDKQPLNK